MPVLVVDDDPLVRSSLRRLLPRFLVEEAGTEAEVLAALNRHPCEAIILDVCLNGPGDRSGVELACKVRRHGWRGALILVSAFCEADLEQHAAAAGADAFFSKGDINRAELRRVIVETGTGRSLDGEEVGGGLKDALDDVLDCAAHEARAHGEKAYCITLFAQESRACTGSVVSVETCAHLLGVTPETMRKHVLVASRWSAVDLWQLLVERTGENGYRISISHLYELARVPTTLRDAWLERCFSEGLSVRALRIGLCEEAPLGAT